MTNWKDLPEVEYTELGDSCIVGDCMCYHPHDAHAYSRCVAEQIVNNVAKNGGQVVQFVGMARGYIQALLVDMLPPPIRLVLWDPHPVLSAQVVKPETMDKIKSRWHIVHTAEQFTELTNSEPPTLKRMPMAHPGMNEVIHWELGYIDWAMRPRGFFHAMEPLKLYPSHRSVHRIGLFGRIPGLHQFDHLGDRDAFVVSQGPCLAESIQTLRLASQRGAVIFAAVQAVKRLNSEGITPHYAVSADPSDVMYQHAKGARFGCLLAESMSPPGVYTDPEFSGRVASFQIMSSHCHQAAADLLGWPCFDDSFATVSEIMVQIARAALGAKRVFMLGCDFGAPPSVKDNPFPQYVSSFRVPSESGDLTWTNAHYHHARRWTEMQARHEPGSVHRYSRCLPVDGAISYARPEDMISQLTARRPYEVKIPAPRESDVLVAATILEYLKRKGLDMNNAENKDHPEDFRKDFSPMSHDRKLSVIETVLPKVLEQG